MCILEPKIIPMRNENNKIPYQQLLSILRVFSYGKREDIKNLPNNFISRRNGDFWTTWDEVLDIRDKIEKEKNNLAEQEAASKCRELLSEMRRIFLVEIDYESGDAKANIEEI